MSSASIKKLNKKKKNFEVKMDELMNLDTTCTADITVSDMNIPEYDENCTLPKQVYYNSSQDILFQAFSREVLMDDNSVTDTDVINEHINPKYFMPQSDISMSMCDDGSESSEILLNISKEEFSNLIACIPTLNEKCRNLESNYSTLNNNYTLLQNNYSNLEVKCTNIEKENNDLKQQLALQSSVTSKEINSTNQYSRRNSLLAHKLRNVPTNLHGTAFSKFIAKELCRIMPNLTLTHYDIDTSHILYYEYINNRRFPVVVVKFLRRDLRNDVLHYAKYNPINSSAFFTEHLTVDNRKLFDAANESYDEVWTEQCRIFAYDINGRRKEISAKSDLPPQPSKTIHTVIGAGDQGLAEVHLTKDPPSNLNNNAPPQNGVRTGRRKLQRYTHPRKKYFNSYRKPNQQSSKSQVFYSRRANTFNNTQQNSINPNLYSGNNERQNVSNQRNSAVQPIDHGNLHNQPVNTTILPYAPRHFNPQPAPPSNISGGNTLPLNNNQLQYQQHPIYNNNNINHHPRGIIPNTSRFPLYNQAPPGSAW